MQKNEALIIAYTERGAGLALRLKGMLAKRHIPLRVFLHSAHAAAAVAGKTAEADGIFIFDDTGKVLEELWDQALFIVFIGAVGIAVRSIAPRLKDKLSDPAVLCIDENAGFVIPILSGHFGGANEWAKRLAAATGAQAVITTATDGRGIFAVDVFAAKNDLVIRDRESIRAVSGALLAGTAVGWCNAGMTIVGEDTQSTTSAVPEGFTACEPGPGPRPGAGVTITEEETLPPQFSQECRLYPKDLCLGIGCRKDTEYGALRDFVRERLRQSGLDARRILRIASIDRKKDEAAIVRLAEELGVPFMTFSADELSLAEGEFSASEFVRSRVGVDNVCERSAVCAAGKGAVKVLKKQAECGMTLAVAREAKRDIRI